MPFNVVVCTPSIGYCRTAYAHSLARMVAYFSQHPVYPEDPAQAIDVRMMEGSGVGSNRDVMVEDFLGTKEATHLLFIDEDMGFNTSTLHIVAGRRQPIVACNYRMRVPPAVFTAVGLDGKRIPTTRESSGIVEATYSGFGFCLIAREVLEAVERPRFLIQWSAETYTTEDLPFFTAARERGYKCYVDHDASKQIWHNGNIAYCWNEDYAGLNADFRRT